MTAANRNSSDMDALKPSATALAEYERRLIRLEDRLESTRKHFLMESDAVDSIRSDYRFLERKLGEFERPLESLEDLVNRQSVDFKQRPESVEDWVNRSRFTFQRSSGMSNAEIRSQDVQIEKLEQSMSTILQSCES